ncbi:MAG TPA: c-type cytochrome [Steroidobacteraceae bacterium]|nr:c-type cytochrome [Steroidobacteraceae bacterium]
MSQTPNDSAVHDKHFYDSFMVVLGLLILVAVVLIFLARGIASETQDRYVRDDDKVRMATEERLAPVAKLAISGQDNSALDAPKQADVVLVDMAGDEVYKSACTACHKDGIAGAPKFGDRGAWAARIAQGKATLYKHALEGYQGKAGFMPAKGGRTDLSEKSITSAVDHIIAAAK